MRSQLTDIELTLPTSSLNVMLYRVPLHNTHTHTHTHTSAHSDRPIPTPAFSSTALLRTNVCVCVRACECVCVCQHSPLCNASHKARVSLRVHNTLYGALGLVTEQIL